MDFVLLCCASYDEIQIIAERKLGASKNDPNCDSRSASLRPFAFPTWVTVFPVLTYDPPGVYQQQLFFCCCFPLTNSCINVICVKKKI